ncbi:methyltransferase 10 domain-containing protein [Coprinopsis cinerea okayama7|uniref:Methyltransferase 10 domain-containing protein n=1 Tax=Coprinopsis cinerea (strain Okayama-7 / 130 / ATCC MYA-4618 / FGSC 9003) TaxID=240176 RepID=A8PEY5_COPC7|nr:methyltransferase 10 domain-containing protein [Coprinopsis cinerea okayama7\|eukprot:XP_001840876.2 methyltransferase 10 domain-containing protein [Coprinopsis cinerea okayama7\
MARRVYLSLHSTMHHRNPYKAGVDFRALAEHHKSLGVHLRNGSTIDFRDEEAQRLNYVLWIQDVMENTSGQGSISEGEKSGGGKIRGLDVGTGSSVIYPLLATSLEAEWEMVGTEIRKGEEERLLPFLPDEEFDFTMCNPPFYSSYEEIRQLQAEKEELPAQVCTGGELEMVYPASKDETQEDWEREGGEVAFVGRMVVESLKLRERCGFSLLSTDFAEFIFKFQIWNYVVTEFIQGRTRRWAVGWSFGQWRVPDDVGRLSHLPPSHPLYKIQPQRTTLTHPMGATSEEHLRRQLTSTLEALAQDDRFIFMPGVKPSTFVVKAAEPVWSRALRRKRKRQVEGGEDEEVPCKQPRIESQVTSKVQDPGLRASSTTSSAVVGDESWALVCLVDFVDRSDRAVMDLRFQWVYGQDRGVFEGFASHVGKKVQTLARESVP